ncbi:type II toxin-antitoxin system RelE/ParE family toxin [Streptomyces desertarenae]|uniref:Type II toxin-antitoxin system RelE/ParE family toxin n=1 Tax=Streptomyces desertarenae TaxID=2666184 RepID=A0ABW4PRC2_9ACTN
MYKLRYSTAVEAVWDALPDEAREELDAAILGVCEDPYAATEPHSDSEPHRRVLTLRHTAVACVVIDGPPGVRRIRIHSIDYLG